jgi:branched-chain amino acid transport system ATP-binding protein
METALRTRGLKRMFGGLAAVDGVSLECCVGRVHAVIGPNGAGKTTLINLLSGDLAPSAGRIEILGRDVSGLAPHRIAQLGVGRSYQRTNIFMSFSAFENCRLAAQARLSSSMRFFRPAASYREVNQAAQRALELCGLQSRKDSPAAALSHGERRQLEVAMALATGPRLLLLDEPMAGMGTEESQRMIVLLQKLKQQKTIILVEHDMDAVFRLADRISVLVYGRVIATDVPERIKLNEEVRRAYLGEET